MPETTNAKPMFAYIDIDALEQFCERGCAHYEWTAPVVAQHLDGLFIRLHEAQHTVTVRELVLLWQLQDTDTGWMHANYATNLVYKIRDILHMETAGMISF